VYIFIGLLLTKSHFLGNILFHFTVTSSLHFVLFRLLTCRTSWLPWRCQVQSWGCCIPVKLPC